jgi:hypothetical protein
MAKNPFTAKRREYGKDGNNGKDGKDLKGFSVSDIGNPHPF